MACACGCGETLVTPDVKGRDRKHLHGHNGRKGVESFWERVDLNGPLPAFRPELGACWIWTGGVYGNGYPAWKGKHASRWIYEHETGADLTGLELDHLCRVIECVRPKHLDPVTHQENLNRGRLANASGLLREARYPA